MTGDLHSPTNAGPDPADTFEPAAQPFEAAGGSGDHPELIVGAAFAGGLVLATILKRLGR
jgi:hypothetical protein